MIRLLWKLALLALPLAATALWLEPRLRAVPNSYNQKWALLAPRLGGLRTLVLGASQENQGVEADLLGPGAFNLACVGQDYWYDRQLALKVLGLAPGLDRVVLSLSYVSLGYRLPDSPESWRQFQYRLYDGLPDEDPGARFDPRNFSALAFLEPGPALAKAWGGFKGDPSVVFGPDGQQKVAALGGDELDFAVNEFTARKRLRYLDSIFHKGAVPGNLALLKDLLDTLRRRGIRTALVVSPVTAEFRGAMDRDAWEGRRALALALARAEGAEFLDHFADPRFSEPDFSDTDHLNAAGAAKYSRELAAELGRREGAR